MEGNFLEFLWYLFFQRREEMETEREEIDPFEDIMTLEGVYGILKKRKYHADLYIAWLVISAFYTTSAFHSF